MPLIGTGPLPPRPRAGVEYNGDKANLAIWTMKGMLYRSPQVT